MRLDIQTKDLPPLRRGVFALGVLSLLFGVIACCAFSVFAWDRLKLVRSGVRAEATVTHSFVRATYGKEKQLMEFEFPLNDGRKVAVKSDFKENRRVGERFEIRYLPADPANSLVYDQWVHLWGFGLVSGWIGCCLHGLGLVP